MPRFSATSLKFALGIAACSLTTPGWAQTQYGGRRPEPKIVVYRQQQESSAFVGVLGQVQQPGTYQFANAPTLELVLASAQGLSPAASPVVRVVRGQRVIQHASLAAAGQEKLQSGDLVIVDPKPARDGLAVQPKPRGVHLALVGVLPDRPLVVFVRPSEARPDAIVQMLGQSLDLLPTVRILTPPGQGAPGNPALPLADGAVLAFLQPQRIQLSELPDDLPPVIPCSLPEPDIGAYGVRNALEERARQDHGPIPVPWRRSQYPGSPAQVPLPAPESAPTPLPPIEEKIAATPAPAEQTGTAATPISTLPYSGTTPIPARPSRLTESAPTAATSAPDAREPTWNNISRSAAKTSPISDDELEEPKSASASGALSLWQMVSIVASAGLLVGVALAVRASQKSGNGRRGQGTASKEPQRRTATATETRRPEPRASIPTPHISAQSFGMFQAQAYDHGDESPALRQQRLTQLLNRELPLIEEPLALRPGIFQNESKFSQRRDAAANDSAASSSPRTTAGGAQQFIDAPHPQQLSGPHQRAGSESPVERALRQLQGGIS